MSEPAPALGAPAPQQAETQTNSTLLTVRSFHREHFVFGDTIPSAKSLCTRFLASVALMVALITTFNLLVNPTGVYPVHLFPVFAWDARHQKAEMMRGVEATGIILGSSHVMKLAPSDIEKATRLRVFNAGVDMATVEDEFAFLRFATEGRHWPVKAAFIAVDPETFSPRISTADGLRQEPSLSRYVAEQSGGSVIWELTTNLVSIDETTNSMNALRWLRAGAPVAHHFDADGYLHYDTWEKQRANHSFDLRPELSHSLQRLLSRYDKFSELSAQKKTLFLHMLDYCESHNIRVVVFVTPLQPSVRRGLQKTTYERLLQDTLAFAKSSAESKKAEFLDLSDLHTFAGSETGFFDGEHVDERNAALMANALAREGKPGAF